MSGGDFVMIDVWSLNKVIVRLEIVDRGDGSYVVGFILSFNGEYEVGIVIYY